jgi:hypothetical protein
MVCYLYAARLSDGIVVEVDIGAFVEAVVRGSLGWRGNIVVDVCEAVRVVNMCACLPLPWCLQCQKRHLALLWRHGVSGSVRFAPGFQDIRRSRLWRHGSQGHGQQEEAKSRGASNI